MRQIGSSSTVWATASRKPRHPRPLQPDVVRLLVGHRVEDRPARERRPPVGVVHSERQAGAQQVAGHVGAAVGAMDLGVPAEGDLDPARVKRLAGDDASARPLVGGDVQVRVDVAAHGAVGVGAPERPAVRARGRLLGRRDGRQRAPASATAATRAAR